jgi:pyruvate formate lyase activating enzyme
LQEVHFYEFLAGKRVKCGICPHRCLLADGEVGLCRVRKNYGGKLYALNYGKWAAGGLDPVEKKPLYHFYPGKTVFSLGALGCNLSCAFCQNWRLARALEAEKEVSPEAILAFVQRAEHDGCIGVAYTYSEPLMWYEFVADTAPLVRERGFKNVLVSNGYIQPEPLAKLLPYLDAVNIDVKAFQENFYRRLCGGLLEPVLKTVEQCVAASCHVELTTLLIPGWNDSPEEIRQLARWIASLDEKIPLHLSRYFPRHKMKLPPTPIKTLHEARSVAEELLSYVYLGNVFAEEGRITYCPNCGQELIRRSDQGVEIKNMTGSHCQSCGKNLPIRL